MLGWTQGGTGQGLGRKAATLAGTQHPLSSPHLVAREEDGTAGSVTIVLGSQEAPRRTTESDGYRGRQQRALPQDSRTGPPPSSLGYPCEAAHSKPLTFVRVPMGQETGW